MTKQCWSQSPSFSCQGIRHFQRQKSDHYVFTFLFVSRARLFRGQRSLSESCYRPCGCRCNCDGHCQNGRTWGRARRDGLMESRLCRCCAEHLPPPLPRPYTVTSDWSKKFHNFFFTCSGVFYAVWSTFHQKSNTHMHANAHHSCISITS